jgi:hypothetical protein
MSTIKVNTLTTLNGLGNITVSRPLSGSGASLTDLPAANLTGTLPAISATNLTNLPAANLTGTLPAISGANLTNLPSSEVTYVQFPASQVASADANRLDDYEEGTWTPVVGGSGGTSGQAYGEQHGTYVKIGRLFICHGTTGFTNKGTITGNVTLSGLPATMANLRENRSCGNVIGWYALGNSMVDVRLTGVENSATATFLHLESAQTNQANSNMGAADLTNTTDLYFSVIFFS